MCKTPKQMVKDARAAYDHLDDLFWTPGIEEGSPEYLAAEKDLHKKVTALENYVQDHFGVSYFILNETITSANGCL